MRQVVFSMMIFLWFVGCATNLLGQERFEKSWVFDKQPEFWSWMEEHQSEKFNRYFKNGVLNIENRQEDTKWSYYSMNTDARADFDAQCEVTFNRVNGLAGLGLLLLSNENYYMFKVAANNTFWIGRYRNSDKNWLSISPKAADGGYDSPLTSLKPVGQRNTLAVKFRNGRCEFFVNGVIVSSLTVESDLPEISKQISSVGFTANGAVDMKVHAFQIRGTSTVRGAPANAFPNVQKTFLTDINANKVDRWSVIAPNGEYLYFIRKDSTVSDDIFSAKASSDSTWMLPVNLGKPLNNKSPNNVISVSQDGNELFLWGNYKTGADFGTSGFSVSKRTKTGWAEPTNITITDYVNTATSREECTNTDRSVVIMSANRTGTYGDKDLWVAFRQPDGTYGGTKNLGAEVNSAVEEGMPFLAADNRTLYFGSNAGGYGGTDIYVSKRLDDTWQKWSPRVNLGPNINTPVWDAYFTIHPSGKYAYMNTSNGYKSGIYRLSLQRNSLNKDYLPDPVVVVRGLVLNAKTKEPVETEIQYADIRTGDALGKARSEPLQGRYSIVLTGGRGYEFFAESAGFFPVSENLIIDTLGVYQEIERNLYLEPITVGAVIRLNNLFFDYDKAELRQESEQELNRVVQLLTQFPNMTVEVSGHTDDRGADGYNKELSSNRAHSVVKYISGKGIVATRLTATGYGKTKPLTKDKSDAGRQKNRRVEFKIVKM